MHNYTLVVDPHAEKDLQKLKRSVPKLLHQILVAIDSLAEQPFQGKALKGEKKGCYSLRQGDYRIIYELYPERRLAHIIRVGHRKEVYR